MILHLDGKLTINNLRNHSPQAVEELGRLLTTGVPARPDPRRKNFYELDAGRRVFYVHITPGTSRVLFLAMWNKGLAKELLVEEFALAGCAASPR